MSPEPNYVEGLSIFRKDIGRTIKALHSKQNLLPCIIVQCNDIIDKAGINATFKPTKEGRKFMSHPYPLKANQNIQFLQAQESLPNAQEPDVTYYCCIQGTENGDIIVGLTKCTQSDRFFFIDNHWHAFSERKEISCAVH